MTATSCSSSSSSSSSMAAPLQYEATPHLSVNTSSPPCDTTSPEDTQIISNQIISDDPALWPKAIDDNARCQIVRKGPLQITDMDFPQNTENPPWRFTKDNYKMTMRNGEKIQRSWLMYSVSTDTVFCFSCTLFGKCDSALSSSGYCAWNNLDHHLKEHEYSNMHCENMRSWHDLQKRLQTRTTIDQTHQNLLQIEIEHWKGVIRRVISIICHLAESNQALRGPSNVLYDHHNGNFLSLVELMAQYDPVLSEHIRRIQNKETKVHYLSGIIQNEIITLVGDKTLEEIVRRVTKAKYFSVIMDCTPDISHKEQLSIVLRIVNCEPSVGVSIAEHFIGFIDIEDTTGRGLTETLLEHLQNHNLNISDCRGQSYDNGSNMMGQKQGVQSRILQNCKALCVPCSSHTLNLVVADAAKSSVLAISFFGVLQRLYNLFSSSVQRWAILKEHVKQLSLKPLSTTRWEACIESVKAVRYQLPQILKALSALQTFAVEKRDSETMSTANALHDELKSWHFLLCTMIWYNVLYQVNLVSKLLQSPDVSLETIKTETQGVRQCLENLRDSGLASCQSDAVEIAEELEIEMELPEKRQRKAAKHYQHEGAAETQSSPEESFKREFFLPLVDTALRSLNDRFSKMEDVYVLYSFLFSKKSMQQVLKSGKIRASCKNLEQTMHDIEADDLELEINSAVYTFPDHASTCPHDMLNYIYSENLLDLYSNLSIALRLLLTLPVSVASGERSFSALKLIKTYLRSTMCQERLTGLALISIERDVRRSLDMEDIVAAFAEAKQQF
ncbi:zinc finger MYM-type protein 1-like [Scomber scombrus]|uniref:zinc finger MYM-type protein 1-like n=1 Tax=Scomber scombrus TaxID=13677 RepID=UPI002DD85389|nr:zinc finger MYM-type protein 1-like [Scomber scombrus]